ncbi:hypothetical protein H8959_005824 [Pygathrix nigripes]
MMENALSDFGKPAQSSVFNHACLVVVVHSVIITGIRFAVPVLQIVSPAQVDKGPVTYAGSVKVKCNKTGSGGNFVGVFKTRKECSSTSNAECDCISGYHCLGAECSMCEQDCKQGQELTKKGCKDCCFGTFNDQKRGVCRPWTNCSLDGKSVLVNGTKERDVVCGPSPADLSPGASSATPPAPAREPGSWAMPFNQSAYLVVIPDGI